MGTVPSIYNSAFLAHRTPPQELNTGSGLIVVPTAISSMSPLAFLLHPVASTILFVGVLGKAPRENLELLSYSSSRPDKLA